MTHRRGTLGAAGVVAAAASTAVIQPRAFSQLPGAPRVFA
eukprot:CAMPEP_0203943852 /NCGR_PEP_ID=MMETSP0359-20131031/79736_1 /ASSEMBLY_ACC=CAM_ASM_000338 /TAXON_ID=268821 /ORGANISM="Scrippsiella Hangoei, Strain SHTV-5" /LENGTH=39 /DNA_ID= /DNA_START= /DNA_END= /DNA_ORIENTATION=